MTAAAPWLRNEPVPDWRRATVAELVEVWRRLRNSHGAMMAADELMRRVAAGRIRFCDPCGCGSGKKFKACCYGKVTTVQQGPSP